MKYGIIHKNFKRAEEYVVRKAKKISEIETWNDGWEIAAERRYNPNTHSEYKCKLCVYEPCYLDLNGLEAGFVDYLEKSDNVFNIFL